MIYGIYWFMHLKSWAVMWTSGIARASLKLYFSLAFCVLISVCWLCPPLLTSFLASYLNIDFWRAEELVFWLGWWTSVMHMFHPRVGDWISYSRPMGGPKWHLRAFLMGPWKTTANAHHSPPLCLKHLVFYCMHTSGTLHLHTIHSPKCPEWGIVKFHPAAIYSSLSSLSWCCESSLSYPDKIPDVSGSDLFNSELLMPQHSQCDLHLLAVRSFLG